MRGLVCGAACAAGIAFAPIASADDAETWSGLRIGALGTYLSSEFDVLNNPATPTAEVDGAILGASLGYDLQFSGVVLGVEGDMSWGNLNQVLRDGNYLTYHTNLSEVSTLRLRAGLDTGDFLPFLTAGMIWTEVEAGAICPSGAAFGVCAVTGPFSAFGTETLDGWVYGIGGEYRVASSWSIKGEVLWTSFDEETTQATWPVVGTFPIVSEQSTDPIVRMGINLRL